MPSTPSPRARLTTACLVACAMATATRATFAQTPAAPTSQPSAAGAATSTTINERYTFVVAHGATAGGWEWKDVAARLLVDGHTTYRPTYTGLGERSHLATPDVDLDTHITDIVNVIRFEDLRDVVLVGHSYGGMVITGVADRVPDRIKALVYVDAVLPEDGESLETARWSTSQPATTSTTQPAAPRRRAPMTQGTLGQPFRPGATPPYNVVQPPKTFSQPIKLERADQTRRIPALYILTVDPGRRATEDAFYAFSQRAAGYGWRVVEMACDHVPSISQPAEMTRLLESAPGLATPRREPATP